MTRRAGCRLVVVGWALLGLGLPAVVANPVLDWNAAMMEAVRLDNSGPTLSTRNLVILNAAIYDAVNSIVRTHQPCQVQFETPEGTSSEAAVMAAGRMVMRALYPGMTATVEDRFERAVAALPDTASTRDGLALGQQAALWALDSRASDGANTQVPYLPSDEPGQWRRTPPYFRPPLDPHWRSVQLFVLPDKEPFLPPPPPALTSPEYADAFDEVRQLGAADSPIRTAEQSEIAVFWSDFSYTAMPPGHWHEIAATIATERGSSLADTARLFALLSLAQADAAIVCWEAKYRFNLWRPVTAIQRADEDGHPETDPDPLWDHFLIAPNFPEYPSGHSTFSKCAAEVLTRFYGTDAIAFAARSDALPGVIRSFTSLAAAADEVGMSRVYGGIHFQFANREGKRSGQRIGAYVCANYLLPNDRLPFVRLEGVDPDGAQLRMHGHAGAEGVLEGSRDLMDWTPLATHRLISGGVVVRDPAGRLPHRFYRVREQ